MGKAGLTTIAHETDGARPLVVAISSRALFDLDASHEVFESRGLEEYSDYQVERDLKIGRAPSTVYRPELDPTR